ncbi:ribose ABC transporter substrate-binding protein RbsB [Thermobrachium celere]|uniref:Ribose ABC transport system, periplasmic ribose-binding protein RbsB (TC 3.A.1.2.1) n=2 Tax=Thermobrachium TaxID=150333 RepID=R7RUB2_9CLOT|nr:ribose ABC transporter substrate-binding protein RbsB [Thermobrachium celere]CDF59021.1 Ribose ABC transport system, periplasmic ribose-binding protein RbsB (TC 3.A.1.2.1) [Thermobrachium celere DSM 8682]
MKKIIKVLSTILALTLVFGTFTGCSSKTTNEGSKKIGMVISTLNNPFFVSMKEGAEKKAKELGYEVVILDSQNDASKERSNVEDLVQQGISVLIINPTDSDAVANSINVAKEKNIPVITVDRGANGVEVACHIASDNVAGGKLAAEFILEKLGGKAKIVELQGIPGASATRDRGKGFHEVVDNKADVKVVASQSADFDRQKGLNVMENIIQATPDFDAVFAHNDEMALGAIKALKTANKNVIVVGFDGTPDAVTAVNNGEMAATIAQQPDLMGSLAIENAVKLMKGESVEKQIPVDLKVIKK